MRKNKFVATLLVFAILFLIIPTSTLAGNERVTINNTSINETLLSIDKTTVPAAIDEEQAEERGHAYRLYDEEPNLNTVIFQNNDGTNTLYLFDYPVKYVNETNETKDISLEFTVGAEKDGTFVSDGNVKTQFPRTITDGITLNYENINIVMIPQGAKDSSAKRSDDNKTLTYAYDDNTDLEYSLTYLGYKEDIVVKKYTGQIEYSFIIYTNGLTLKETDSAYDLIDEKGEIKACIGEVVIFTADELNNTFGRMSHKIIKENQEYLLTIYVDADYLKDDKTAYPIRIDPTIEINYTNNGAGAIEDVTLNSLSGSDGSSGSLTIGYRETYGISRILMRFPGLNLSGITSADQITSASVEVRDLMCEGTSMLTYCYVFNGNTWSESTANWNNVSPSSYVSQQGNGVTISYSNGANLNPTHRYSYNITSAVKAWKNGTYSQNKGIMIKSANAVENGTVYNSKTLCSYNRSSSYRPSLVINYTGSSGGGSSFSTATTLSLNTSTSVIIASANVKRYFKYTPTTTGFFTFESSSVTSGDPYAWLYNSSQTQLLTNDDGAGYPNFRITYHLKSGQTYYFAAGCYNTGTGSYTVKLTSNGAYNEASISTKVYYMKNMSSGKVVDIDGPGAQEWIHQWTFHAGSQSKWTIQKQSDGYYTIRSEYGSKYYIGISNTSVGSNNIKLYSNISDSTRWKIYQNSAGELLFEPKNAPGRILNAPNNNTAAKLQLAWAVSIQKNSKWKNFEHKYNYTIKNYYDQGYDVRFSNASSLMAEYQAVCSNIFLEVFGIGTSSSIQSYTSCADDCTGTPVTIGDTTTGCSGWHLFVNHKSSNQIRSDLISQFGNGTTTTSRVAWTGHLLDTGSSNSVSSSHTVVMTIGMVTDGSNNNLGAAVIRRERIYTLLHESSHQLGAPDHYCYDTSSSNCNNPTNDCWRCDNGLSSPPTCVMSSRWSDLETRLNNGTLSGNYCAQCRSSTHSLGIVRHLNNHHK